MALAKTLIAGARKRFPNGAEQVTVGNVPTTIDQLTAELQSFVDNRTAVEAAQVAATKAVETERAQAPSLIAILIAFVAFVRGVFGQDTAALADFGLEPHKAPAPLSAEQKAVAAAKRKATREARGTASTKAKKGIKGNVTAKLVVTPATPASPPVPAAAPAPAAEPSAPPVPATGNGGTPPAHS